MRVRDVSLQTCGREDDAFIVGVETAETAVTWKKKKRKKERNILNLYEPNGEEVTIWDTKLFTDLWSTFIKGIYEY